LLSHLRNTYKQTTSSVSAMTDAKVAVKVAVKAITISLIRWCGQCKFDTIVWCKLKLKLNNWQQKMLDRLKTNLTTTLIDYILVDGYILN
jgi:hypothetical protein